MTFSNEKRKTTEHSCPNFETVRVHKTITFVTPILYTVLSKLKTLLMLSVPLSEIINTLVVTTESDLFTRVDNSSNRTVFNIA